MADIERPALEGGLTFLASYPKSGNTWVRLLIRAYFHGTERKFAFFDDIAQFPYQCASPLPADSLTAQQQAQLRPAALLHVARMAGPYRALVKTHHGSQSAEGMPLFCELWTDRVVHMVRDPRDVLPSLADHMGLDLEGACEMLCSSAATLDDRQAGPEDQRMTHHLGSWSDHTGSWLRQDRVDRETFHFEDLKADTEGTFREMLAFLGEGEVDGERLEVAVDRTDLSNLQRIEEEVGFREASPHSEDGFFRTGKTGKTIPDELRERIEAEHGEIMEQLGYL